VFTSFDDLLAAVDVVAFSVPPAVQAPLAVRAARAGRHLVLDKPIAADLAAAEDLADAVQHAGVVSVVVLTRRFARETREFLAAAQDGDWAGGAGVWLSGAALGGPYAASAWRHQLGALADVGPHVLDLRDAALGTITAVRHAHRDARSDTWQVGLQHAGGRVSTATLSLRTPVVPSVLRVGVHGAGGLVELTTRDTSALECYRTLLDELIDCARSGATHPLGVRRGRHLQWVGQQVLQATLR